MGSRKKYLWKSGSDDFQNVIELIRQGYSQDAAVSLVVDSSNRVPKERDLEAPPTLKELNHYITDMASSYYNIGLELDIVNSKLKVIKNNPALPNLEEKCLEMLEVWLENDTSATWRKLCEALQQEHIGLKVLAGKIAKDS